MEAAFETSHLEDDNISDGPHSASPVKMDYLRRFQLLNFREVTRLGDVMETVVPIHGTGNFPTLEIRPSEFVELVRRRLASIGIRVHDIRLNGSAATHVLSQDVEPNYKDLDLIFAIDFPPSDFERSSEAESPRTKPRLKSPSSSHGLGAGEEQLRRRKMRPSSLPTTPRQRASKGAHHQEELSTLDDSGYTSSGSSVSSAPESPSSSSSFHQSIRERSLRMRTGSIESASSSASSRRDVTPLLRHQQHVVEQQHKDRCWQMIKDEVMAALLEFMPEGVSRTRMNSVVLGGAYVQKMVKVTNESDRWSLISLNNNTGRNLELKFVQNMRRQFEFSVDSFQIVLDTYLGFKRAANSSSQRPEDHQDRQEEQQDGKDNKTHEEVHQDQKDHQILPRDVKENQNLPKDHKDHQNHHQDLKDHPPMMNERFHPTVIAESVYGDFAAAIRHLNHRRICTHRPEEIRGGGLLRYCNLLVRDYRPGDCDDEGRDVQRPLDPSSSAHPGDVARTEQHMCSRFFIDFSDIGCQQRKLIGYLDGHFGAEADLKFQYLLQLRKVVSSSTVCLMQHERTLILDLITSLVRQTLAQNVAKHDSTFQPYPYPYQGGVYYQAAPGYYEHGPQYFTSSVVYPLGPPPPHPISERSSPMSSYSSLAPSTHGETCSTSPSPAPLSRPMTPNNPQLCVSYYQEPMMVGDHQGLYPHPHYQPQHHRCCCCGCCCCCGGHLYEQQPFTQPPPTCNGGYGPRVESYRHCPPPITPPIVYSPGTMTCSYHPAAYTAAKPQQA